MGKNQKSKPANQETNIREKCNKCGSFQFAIDKRTNYRHCQGKHCGNVWAQKDVDALLLQQAKEKITELENEINALCQENQKLKEEIDRLTGFETDDAPLPSQNEKSFPESDFAK